MSQSSQHRLHSAAAVLPPRCVPPTAPLSRLLENEIFFSLFHHSNGLIPFFSPTSRLQYWVRISSATTTSSLTSPAAASCLPMPHNRRSPTSFVLGQRSLLAVFAALSNSATTSSGPPWTRFWLSSPPFSKLTLLSTQQSQRSMASATLCQLQALLSMPEPDAFSARS